MAPPNATTGENTETPATPLDVRIRSFRPEDYKVVLELYIAGMHYYCPPGENLGLRGYVERTLHEDMAEGGIEGTYFASGGHFWVATTQDERGDEKIIGSIAIEGKDDNRGELRRLSVHEDYRRHGLARKLVAHLEKWGAENGFRAVFLNTGWEMKPAIKLYEALGFTLTHKHVMRENPYAALFFYEKKLIPQDV